MMYYIYINIEKAGWYGGPSISQSTARSVGSELREDEIKLKLF